MEEELIYTQETKKQSMLSFYLSGAVAGVVSIAVSHPADTVKVCFTYLSIVQISNITFRWNYNYQTEALTLEQFAETFGRPRDSKGSLKAQHLQWFVEPHSLLGSLPPMRW